MFDTQIARVCPAMERFLVLLQRVYISFNYSGLNFFYVIRFNTDRLRETNVRVILHRFPRRLKFNSRNVVKIV